MIPAITPPTDNLYKLIALFGLGILILAVMNYGTQQSDVIKSKIEIEELEKEIFGIVHHYDTISVDFEKNEQANIVKYDKISDLNKQIEEVEKMIMKDKKLPHHVKTDIATKIDIIEIKTATIQKQERTDLLLVIISLVLMSAGFILWYKKEQRWNDLELKQKTKN